MGRTSTLGWTGGKRAFQLPRRWLTESSLETLAANALKRQAAGGEAIPYVLEDATGGLGARQGGRPFGVELEFDIPGTEPSGLNQLKIGKELHALGLTPHRRQTDAHTAEPTSVQAGGWRYERDCSVTRGGEVVSPIMFDEREAWENLRRAIGVIRRNGGQVTASVGGHVHVGTGDFGDDAAPYQSIVDLFHRYKPELYALGTNPEDGVHRYLRGSTYCQPNDITHLSEGSLDAFVQRHQFKWDALNFAGVTGKADSHVEFRIWDGSLDPSVVQTLIKVSLAIAERAKNPVIGPHPALPVPGEEAGKPELPRLARLLEELFPNMEDRRQAATLFALVVEASKR